MNVTWKRIGVIVAIVFALWLIAMLHDQGVLSRCQGVNALYRSVCQGVAEKDLWLGWLGR